MLGPVRVWRGGESVELGPTARKAVLGLLAVACDEPLPRAVIVDALWPGRPPPSAANIIQTHVKHLRRLLEPDRPPRAPSAVVRRSGDGYLLRADAVAVDLARFRHLVGSAAAVPPDQAAALLDEALRLWRGPPLMDIPVLATHPMVVALAGERQATLSRYGALMIACGRADEALPELTAAAAAQPLDEAAQAQLIRAYQAAGRRAQAFATYHDVRRQLADELGVDPGAELTAAHAALLRADVASDACPGRLHGECCVRADRPVPAQLPADVAGFTGRTAELAELDRLLDADATKPAAAVICAVSGTAGVGKTAVAVRWAHRVRGWFPDGQLYLDLRGYDAEQPMEPRAALARLLRALGDTDPDGSSDVDECAARYRSLVDGRRMLVVLDNAGSVEQIRPLLPGSASCLVLVTSRNSLSGLVARHGAHRIELDLLPLDDAIALIRRLIGARVDEERNAAVALATHCARLPLALRVAAELGTARPDAALSNLVQELADQRRRLNLLDAGGDPRTGVRAILSWSYQHLPPDAARMFRRMGLHPGPDLDPYAAAALAGHTLDETRWLADVLVRAHLVQRSADRRYSMHDLLRVYAVELAGGDPQADRDAAMTGLLDHYLHTAAAAMNTLHPAEGHRRPEVPPSAQLTPRVTDPGAAHAWLESERANLIAAAAHAATYRWPEHSIRLTLTLFRHLEGGGRYADALAIHGSGLLATRRTGDRRSRAHLLTNVAVMHARQGRHPQVIDHLQRALVLYRETGDRGGEARALGNLAVTLGGQGSHAVAIGYLQQALTMCREAGEQHGEVRALCNLGWLHAARGNHPEAARYLADALVLCRRIGDPVGEAVALDYTGELHHRRGEHVVAAEHHAQARTIAHRTDQRVIEASALNGLGEASSAQGKPAPARQYHQQALALALDLGDRYQQARAHAGLARAGEAGSAPPEGRTVSGHWHQALALYAALHDPQADRIRAHLDAGRTTSGAGRGVSRVQ